jgi:chromate reductase, NAD(P)H dehydrogenase (quinone)
VSRSPEAAEFLIAGIAGSLRAKSYNLGLLKAAAELLPEGVTLDIITLHDVPPYNADLQAAEGDPPPAADLKRRVGSADGVLIATPE